MKEEIFCTHCGSPLDQPIYLELDQRTNTYTNEPVPKEFSQGGFPFGKVCAPRMLEMHKSRKQVWNEKNKFIK